VISRVQQVTRQGWAARRRALQQGQALSASADPKAATKSTSRSEPVTKATKKPASAKARRMADQKKRQSVQRTKRR